ncbi:MAG: DUF1993 domain-containing protein [Sphingobium sp.]|uniref:DUF1993 domain-containing protein n=1 Tax=Sphingobium sp. TaxID=1912891 RepID=UPI000DB268E1|nr:DUF1993 domain-containing protein [Sphingobium sp.]PZU13033.1 MAG: DUF1993 domain-containing protein [Sphingobium sp.]
MTPEHLLVSSCAPMLRSLSTWLDKAGAAGGDALLSARLAPDMFPLATQVRFACVQPREGMHRLAGEEFSPDLIALLDEARDGGDRPGTLDDARARIAETLALIDGFAGKAGADPERPIAHALPIGTTFDLTATQYVRDWVLAQFYFHVMTTYAILRANGVPLGKGDYVAHLLPFLRPAPAATA